MLNKAYVDKMYQGEINRNRNKNAAHLTDEYLMSIMDYWANHTLYQTAKHFKISDRLVKSYKIKARARGLL